MPQNLDEVASASPEGEEIARVRIAPEIPPQPAAPACSSRDACPSRPSQATPAPRLEPGSSPLQHRDHARQRRRVDRPIDDHTAIARKHDLYPPARRRSHRDVIVGSRVQRRSARLVA